MKKFEIEIDGRKISARSGATILEVARENGIDIPTLCYNEQIKPSGACRMCMVEITKNQRSRLVASCVYPVEENLVVKTDTEEIKKIRRMIIELLWAAVPAETKEKYGPAQCRFASENTKCTLCGLCVRFCAEIAGKNAAYFKGRGADRQVAIVPELAEDCALCGKCFFICTGGAIVDLYEKAENPDPAPAPK